MGLYELEYSLNRKEILNKKNNEKLNFISNKGINYNIIYSNFNSQYIRENKTKNWHEFFNLVNKDITIKLYTNGIKQQQFDCMKKEIKLNHKENWLNKTKNKSIFV